MCLFAFFMYAIVRPHMVVGFLCFTCSTAFFYALQLSLEVNMNALKSLTDLSSCLVCLMRLILQWALYAKNIDS